MTEEQHYLFDLNGYLTVLRALPADLVEKIAAEMDLLEAESTEEATTAGAIRNTRRDRFECVSIKIDCAFTDAGPNNEPFLVIPGSHKANFAHPYADRLAKELTILRLLLLAAGEAVLYGEALSHALTNPKSRSTRWLLYQYGPSTL